MGEGEVQGGKPIPVSCGRSVRAEGAGHRQQSVSDSRLGGRSVSGCGCISLPHDSEKHLRFGGILRMRFLSSQPEMRPTHQAVMRVDQRFRSFLAGSSRALRSPEVPQAIHERAKS